MIIPIDCIEVNKPTVNNRIYTEEAMVKMVASANKKIENNTLFVTNQIEPCTSLESIMGKVKNCAYDKSSGKITIEVEQQKNKMDIEALLGSKKFKITPNVIGTINKDNEVIVEDFVNFVITPDYASIPKE